MTVLRQVQHWLERRRSRRPLQRVSTMNPCAEALEDRCLLSVAAVPVQRVPQPLRPESFSISWEPAGRYVRLNLPGLSRNIPAFSGALVLESREGDTTLVAVEDFNSDGLPDAAVNFGSSIQLFLGQADGSFVSAFELIHEQAAVSSLLLPGDFDGDGNRDLLSVSQATDGESLLTVISAIGGNAFQVASVDTVGTEWLLDGGPALVAQNPAAPFLEMLTGGGGSGTGGASGLPTAILGIPAAAEKFVNPNVGGHSASTSPGGSTAESGPAPPNASTSTAQTAETTAEAVETSTAPVSVSVNDPKFPDDAASENPDDSSPAPESVSLKVILGPTVFASASPMVNGVAFLEMPQDAPVPEVTPITPPADSEWIATTYPLRLIAPIPIFISDRSRSGESLLVVDHEMPILRDVVQALAATWPARLPTDPETPSEEPPPDLRADARRVWTELSALAAQAVFLGGFRPATDNGTASAPATTVVPADSRLLIADLIRRSTDTFSRLVNGFFETFLGRVAVDGEEAGWVALLLRGQTEEEVLAAFLSTEEFGQRAVALTGATTPDESFVQAVYHLLLQRRPGEGEQGAWLASLANVGRSGVASFLLASTEYRQRRIASFFAEFAGRAGTAAEVSAWANAPFPLLDVHHIFESRPDLFR